MADLFVAADKWREMALSTRRPPAVARTIRKRAGLRHVWRHKGCLIPISAAKTARNGRASRTALPCRRLAKTHGAFSSGMGSPSTASDLFDRDPARDPRLQVDRDS